MLFNIKVLGRTPAPRVKSSPLHQPHAPRIAKHVIAFSAESDGTTLPGLLINANDR